LEALDQNLLRVSAKAHFETKVDVEHLQKEFDERTNLRAVELVARVEEIVHQKTVSRKRRKHASRRLGKLAEAGDRKVFAKIQVSETQQEIQAHGLARIFVVDVLQKIEFSAPQAVVRGRSHAARCDARGRHDDARFSLGIYSEKRTDQRRRGVVPD